MALNLSYLRSFDGLVTLFFLRTPLSSFWLVNEKKFQMLRVSSSPAVASCMPSGFHIRKKTLLSWTVSVSTMRFIDDITRISLAIVSWSVNEMLSSACECNVIYTHHEEWKSWRPVRRIAYWMLTHRCDISYLFVGKKIQLSLLSCWSNEAWRVLSFLLIQLKFKKEKNL